MSERPKETCDTCAPRRGGASPSPARPAIHADQRVGTWPAARTTARTVHLILFLLFLAFLVSCASRADRGNTVGGLPTPTSDPAAKGSAKTEGTGTPASPEAASPARGPDPISTWLAAHPEVELFLVHDLDEAGYQIAWARTRAASEICVLWRSSEEGGGSEPAPRTWCFREGARVGSIVHASLEGGGAGAEEAGGPKEHRVVLVLAPEAQGAAPVWELRFPAGERRPAKPAPTKTQKCPRGPGWATGPCSPVLLPSRIPQSKDAWSPIPLLERAPSFVAPLLSESPRRVGLVRATDALTVLLLERSDEDSGALRSTAVRFQGRWWFGDEWNVDEGYLVSLEDAEPLAGLLEKSPALALLFSSRPAGSGEGKGEAYWEFYRLERGRLVQLAHLRVGWLSLGAALPEDSSLRRIDRLFYRMEGTGKRCIRLARQLSGSEIADAGFAPAKIPRVRGARGAAAAKPEPFVPEGFVEPAGTWLLDEAKGEFAKGSCP
jgi:hypothetical protein